MLEGQIPQQELRRFSENLMETSGTVEFRLRFKKKRHVGIHITGTASTVVTMACQYCLEPVKLEVKASIAQIVVGSEVDAEELDFQQDILVVEGETIELAAIIEDDLILNLPMVAMHGADQAEENGTENCLGRLEYEPQDEVLPVKSSPFAVLNQLKVEKSAD